VALLPAEAVKAYIDEELPGAQAWADRAGLDLIYDSDQLRLRVHLEGSGPGGDEKYLLEGRLDDYKTLPPIWNFLHPETAAEIGISAFPAAPQPAIGGPSIFIQHALRGAVICAHFNRWAYAQEGGPHGDWGESSNWHNVTGGTIAKTLGDMLERINVEVKASPGRMAALP
jgi:hypothetical protein